MKQEAHCMPRGNALFLLDGTPLPARGCPEVPAGNAVREGAGAFAGTDAPLSRLTVRWQDVGTEEEGYDEAFLAALRDALKALEPEGRYVFVEPVAEDAPAGQDGRDAFVASFTHCARRIKDCAAVVGFAIPAGASPDEAAAFQEALRKKHGHYVFFSTDAALLSADQGLVAYGEA